MSIKSEEILSYLGIEADTVEAFKEKFEPEYARVSTISQNSDLMGKIFGKKLGVIDTKIKQAIKKYGVDFSEDELKDLKIEDVVDVGMKKFAGINAATIKELEEKVGKSSDEAVKLLEEKYNKVAAREKEKDSLLESLKNKLKETEESKNSEVKALKINWHKQQALGKVKLKSPLTDIEKRGFMDIINEKYEWDIDENDNAFIKDKTTGKRLNSAKVHGTFKSDAEILEEEAISAGVFMTNPKGGQPARFNTDNTKNNTSVATGTEGRKIFIHPRARG